MRYSLFVKCWRGGYWWLDKKCMSVVSSMSLLVDAESDEEALYISALLGNVEPFITYNDMKKITPLHIVNLENRFIKSNSPDKLDDMIDNPINYINQNEMWMSMRSPYIRYIRNQTSGQEVWSDETTKADYQFPDQEVFTAWYGPQSKLEKDELDVLQSRSYYSPNQIEAVISAAARVVLNYYKNDTIRTTEEPRQFYDMMYDLPREFIKAIMNKDNTQISKLTSCGLLIGLIQNSKGEIVWKSDYLSDHVVIPERH